MLTDNPKDYPVIVAIDFGTTFSGCCFAAKVEGKVYDISGWPKSQGFYGKVPSLAYYKGTRMIHWGQAAQYTALKPKQTGVLIEKFKMWLMDDEEDAVAPQHHGLSTVDVIAEYLGKLHAHVLDTLARQWQDYSPDDYCYCVTVPAIWDDRAKGRMRRACVQAGIVDDDDPLDRLTLISEPEAAMLYCQRMGTDYLKDGDQVLIIDAGGGTLDLIIYRVDKPASTTNEMVGTLQDEVGTLQEVVAGTGGICGSKDIDERMREYLLDALGPQAKHMPSCTMEDILARFTDYIKPDFEPEGDPIPLDIPGAALAYIDKDKLDEDACFQLDRATLVVRVFDPVVEQVLDVIQAQLDLLPTEHRRVDVAFLVGGFGSSEHLQRAIRRQFVDSGKIGTVLVPPQPGMAIVRGAVHHMLQPAAVKTKVLRVTYGLRTRLPFEQGRDPEHTAIVTSDGVKRCATRFDIIAQKGQTLRVGDAIKRTFWVNYPKHSEADIYVYSGEGIPRYIDDEGVLKLVEFPLRMPVLPNASAGDPIDISMSFFFGPSELQIDVYIQNKHIQLTTLYQ